MRDIVAGQAINLKFTSRSSNTPTTLAGSPVVSVYKANNITQSTTGVTLTVDFDSVTGLNNVLIDTSTDTTFYAAGNDFYLVITTGTVGGTSVVGEVVGDFSIQNQSPQRPLGRGTVAAGATTTSVPTSALFPTATDTDQLKGRVLIFDVDTTTAGLRGEGAIINAMTAGGTLAVDQLSRAPASGDRFGVY